MCFRVTVDQLALVSRTRAASSSIEALVQPDTRIVRFFAMLTCFRCFRASSSSCQPSPRTAEAEGRFAFARDPQALARECRSEVRCRHGRVSAEKGNQERVLIIRDAHPRSEEHTSELH